MDPLEAEKWLEEMEMVFEVLECNNKEKVFFVVYQLKGNARDWWKAERMTHEQDVTTMSLNKFKDLFYDNYFPTSTRQQKEVEILKLEQGSMTVSEYRAKFLELAKFAGRWIGDEVGKTRKFKMGLQPRIRQIVVPFHLNNFSGMVEKSLLIERELNITKLIEDEQTMKQSFPITSQGSFLSRN
ncbi:uncharacterized protein LOC124935130 [Impatiens glandulifera]|uniref:uncharacterized protein LOC124935130 n=1 Tax=Impatiens glandulifera TaxID=253017 RepID=UPI001FB11C71|nr:uncharacterized protein LOC124935130 [Impatiens glandulifera]